MDCAINWSEPDFPRRALAARRPRPAAAGAAGFPRSVHLLEALLKRIESKEQGPQDPRTVIGFYHVDLAYKDQMALTNISFNVANGEFICLTGPSGAGKTSILRLISMDAFPTKGQVIIRGMMASKMNRRKVPLLRREIGFVFQDFRLLEDRNIYDNVAFAQLVVGVRTAEIKRNVMRVLTQVGLWDKRHRLPRQLSGGEQQRAAIARAMVNSPKILLADEPTGNLDPVNAQETIDLLFRINDSGTCVVFSTHDQQIVKSFGERVILMKDGRIASDIHRKKSVDRTANLTDRMYRPGESVQGKEPAHA
jgi:cell division transport system ATP-binding protein